MKALVFGSLNIDYVYSVDHIVMPGETISSGGRSVFVGGKGLNQSIALARAGMETFHAGIVGPEGGMLIDALRDSGVDVHHVKTLDAPTGHTFIQVDQNGQNSIVLFGGTNQMITESFIDEVLADFGEGDLLLLQNEINLLPSIIEKGAARGMLVALNPSPFDAKISACDLSRIGLFFVNEVEGAQISGESKDQPEKILDWFAGHYPESGVILTLGADGAWFMEGKTHERTYGEAVPTEAVDTTAAGDTFTGYFLASYCRGRSPAYSLNLGARAASVAVSKPGAAPSIPFIDEL